MKLNIGAGTKIIEGWINIDILPRSYGLLMMDARKLGFINNSIDEIKAEDVLEHISFKETISVLKEWYRVLKEGGKTVALIKPQFEAGRGEVGKGGIIRDESKHKEIVEKIKTFSEKTGFAVHGVTESPIKGADGNKEFLIYLEKM